MLVEKRKLERHRDQSVKDLSSHSLKMGSYPMHDRAFSWVKWGTGQTPQYERDSASHHLKKHFHMSGASKRYEESMAWSKGKTVRASSIHPSVQESWPMSAPGAGNRAGEEESMGQHRRTSCRIWRLTGWWGEVPRFQGKEKLGMIPRFSFRLQGRW